MPVEYTPQVVHQAIADPVAGYALNAFDWSVVVPEETQNYFNNPSFEGGTPVGITFSNATGGVVNTESVFGLNSYRVVPVVSAACWVKLADPYNNPCGPVPAGPMTISAYVKFPAGDTISITILDIYNSASSVTSTFTATGAWQRIYVTSLVRPNFSIYINVQISRLNASLLPFYVDGVQIEAKSYPTTYCDGTQDGCAWSGPPNGSFSYRKAGSPGGREYRLRNLGFLVTAISGHDMPPYQTEVQPYGLVGGQKYQRTVPLAQVITLSNVIEGTTYPVTRKAKDRIIELLAPSSSQYQDKKLYLLGKHVDDCKKENPIQIGPTLRIQVRAGGDLSGINDNYNQERFALSFICDNPPAVEAVFESGQSLTQSAVLTGFAGRMTYYKASLLQVGLTVTNPNRWQTPSAIVSSGTAFQTTALSNQALVLPYPTFGPFSIVLATWNGTNAFIVDAPTGTTTIMGSARNNTINALVFDPTGILYVGGAWTNGPAYMGKLSSTGLISAMGTTNIPNAVVRALVVVPYQSVLYAFGDFTNSGTRWGLIGISGATTWVNPTGGAGFNGTVRGALLLQNGKILVYGDFTSVDGVAYNRVVIFDPYSGAMTFSPVSKGFSNGSVRTAVQLPNGDIVLGGTFTTTGTGLTTNYVAIYNGSQILPLGNNVLGGQVNSLAYFGGAVYAAGVYLNVPDAIGRNQACYGLVMLVGDYWITPDIFTLFDTTTVGGTFVGTVGGALYASSSASLGAAIAAGVTSVTYDGTADAYPSIVISATVQSTIFSIVNQATGAALYFNNLIIAAGETVTIETTPTGIAATSSVYGDISQFIMSNSDFSGFSLVKRNTADAAATDYTNQIQVLVSLTGTIDLHWRTAFQGFSAAATATFNGL